MLFKCEKCEKTFDNQYNFTRHTKRTNSCKPASELIECNYCNKKFTDKTNLSHHKKVCKGIVKNTPQVAGDYNIINSQTNDSLINSLNNSLNNSTIIINNYHINPYCEENLDYLTKEIIKKIIMDKGRYKVLELIKLIYLNEEHPENMNMHLVSKKNTNKLNIKYSENGEEKWETVDKLTHFSHLFGKDTGYLSSFVIDNIKEIYELFDDTHKIKVDNFLNKYIHKIHDNFMNENKFIIKDYSKILTKELVDKHTILKTIAKNDKPK